MELPEFAIGDYVSVMITGRRHLHKYKNTQKSWPCLIIKNCLSRYGNFHYKDKMAIKLYYLCEGNLYACKTASLY